MWRRTHTHQPRRHLPTRSARDNHVCHDDGGDARRVRARNDARDDARDDVPHIRAARDADDADTGVDDADEVGFKRADVPTAPHGDARRGERRRRRADECG